MKVREFFCRMPWIWWFLANLSISILQIFSSRTQPWWVLQIIIITTKINTLDYCKSDKDVFEEHDYFIYWITEANCFWSGKKGSIFNLSQWKTTLFQHFCQGKYVYFSPKVRENYSGELLGTLIVQTVSIVYIIFSAFEFQLYLRSLIVLVMPRRL